MLARRGCGKKERVGTELTNLFDAIEEAVQFGLLGCQIGAVVLLEATGPTSLLRNQRLSFKARQVSTGCMRLKAGPPRSSRAGGSLGGKGLVIGGKTASLARTCPGDAE